MKIKTVNKIIIILSLTLCSCLFGLYKACKGKSIPTTSKVSVKDTKEVFNEKVENFKTKINATNKLLVLEGTTDVSATFDSNENENVGNMLKWCKAKLANLDAKTLTVNEKFKFGYSYNLKDIVITKLADNKIKIVVYQSRLQLEYLEEINGSQKLQSEKAIFATQFTPQQIAGLTDRVNTYTHNNIINNTDIRLKAIESTQANILSIAKVFGFDVDIEVMSDGLLESDTSTLSNIEYK